MCHQQWVRAKQVILPHDPTATLFLLFCLSSYVYVLCVCTCVWVVVCARQYWWSEDNFEYQSLLEMGLLCELS